jgi:hypothetical protein
MKAGDEEFRGWTGRFDDVTFWRLDKGFEETV